ncbi:unnamed protein product, partial [Amoebophrya sp. A25]
KQDSCFWPDEDQSQPKMGETVSCEETESRSDTSRARFESSIALSQISICMATLVKQS